MSEQTARANEELIAMSAHLLSNGSYKLDSFEEPKISREDQIYYAPRVSKLLKGMMRGRVTCERLASIHDKYVFSVVEYMREIDRCDALQKVYQQPPLKSNRPQVGKPVGITQETTIKRDLRTLASTRQAQNTSLSRLVTITDKKKHTRYPRVKDIEIKTFQNRYKEHRSSSSA